MNDLNSRFLRDLMNERHRVLNRVKACDNLRGLPFRRNSRSESPTKEILRGKSPPLFPTPGPVIAKPDLSFKQVAAQDVQVPIGDFELSESDDDSVHEYTCLLYTSPSPRDS